jgi:hypothetical protein
VVEGLASNLAMDLYLQVKKGWVLVSALELELPMVLALLELLFFQHSMPTSYLFLDRCIAFLPRWRSGQLYYIWRQPLQRQKRNLELMTELCIQG